MLNEEFSEILDLSELNIIIEKMINISLKENSYLKQMDAKNLAKLFEEKLVLIFLMTKIKNLIKNDDNFKNKFSEEERNNIKEKYKILEDITKRNLALAGYAASSNRKMLELLDKNLSKNKKRLNIYNNRGGAIIGTIK